MAFADFLYQYKSSEYYPRDFVAWNYASSSQVLDSHFEPLLVAFNRDIATFLKFLQERFEGESVDKNVSFAAEGMVTVRLRSGSQANVATTTQSHFPQPPTVSVNRILSEL